MDWLLYCIARGLLAALQALPLRVVARIGRFFGGAFYWIDKRHRRVATNNLAASFPEESPDEIRALAKENFRRIGENWAGAIKVASMSHEQILKIMTLKDVEKVTSLNRSQKPQSLVFAIGHFGNFELFASAAREATGYQAATTYRALRSDRLNRLMNKLRSHSGCLFFERRTDGGALRAAMRDSRIMLGLLADQSAGDRGLRLPFFGRDCSTSKAPAVYALRFGAPLHTGICYRTELARWQVEIGDEIPTMKNGEPRCVADIMLDVNRAFEVAVARDPANWFWVHNRWKKPPPVRVAAETQPDKSDENEMP